MAARAGAVRRGARRRSASRGEEARARADRLYDELREPGLDVLYDDRDVEPGREVRRRRAARLPAARDGRQAERSRRGELEVQVRRGREKRSLPLEGAAEAAAELWRDPPLTFRRLVGLDRSGRPAAARRAAAQPLNPWTIPNAIGFVRLALCPVFLVVALSSGDGHSGRRVRAVRRHRVERLLRRHGGPRHRASTAGSARCSTRSPTACSWSPARSWPSTSSCCRAGRSLVLARARAVHARRSRRLALQRGIDLNVSMLGRWAVWPVMSALALALLDGRLVPGPRCSTSGWR